MTALHLDVHRNPQSLDALAPEWRALWAAATQATPFDAPEWLVPWWKHFGRGELRALAVRDDAGQLRGVAPLYIRDLGDGHRDLAFLGTGNSDYVGLLAADRDADAAAEAVLSYAADIASEWDRCALGPLAPDSPLASAALPNGWDRVVTHGEPCPVLDVSNGIELAIPRRFLRQLRYAGRRLAREATLRFECADCDTAGACLDILAGLHERRWRTRGEAGVLADREALAFHRDAVSELTRSDVARLYVLSVNDEPVAALYGLVAGLRFHYYIGGFDPAFERHSVGSLVLLHAIERAVAEGATQVDFLRGAEAYKYRWGAVDRQGLHCALSPARGGTA